ncbi:TraX family protein [Lactobacillus kefiranofaciens]|uniref:TraX family protein n=1 Tax=Lactobacillus kefiranofaciens TaxID=267818 RepID=UPI00117A613E|nr:TraX family protein [Lactobacillus kefiranofaciens]
MVQFDCRFVAPLFVYFLVEGFFHTSNRKRYLFRILGAAAVTWIGEIIINLAFHNTSHLTHTMTVYSVLEGNNILVTLAIFLGIMWAIELFRENKRKWWYLILAIFLTFLSAIFEGGLYLLAVLFIFYFGYHKPKIESWGIFIWCLIWCLLLFIKALITAHTTRTDLYSSLTFTVSG